MAATLAESAITHVSHARTVTWTEGVDGPREVLPGEVLHVHGGVVGPPSDGAVLYLRLARTLVEVCLGHKDRESDIIDPDVAPRYVLRETLQALSVVAGKTVSDRGDEKATWPPIQDLKRAAYTALTTVISSNLILDTFAKEAWFCPSEPMLMPWL